MELNEVTKRLPKHLLQFVVDQPYNEYTPVDQAVWRYVMRQNYHHLQKVAHESYVEGLKLAGVEIENIPTMYGMNRILQRIGWAAVAVDGFIPPGAFMEFTKYNVLVIAADIRTLEHIEYTPAPDIIHESAGHAPIIAVPEFAAYLKDIGEAGSKAFSSVKDVELYEAIRHLSIIKEDPHTKQAEINEAELAIERIQSNMGPPSEMALIRNLHWWTVEYGLIGTLDKFKLYGAGLLSSIGEGMSCLNEKVKKLPYTLEAMHCNYDITKPQPQLFVTPDFAHLTTVLSEFKKLMAWTTGWLDGIKKAIASEQIGTIVYSSGLQVTGTVAKVIEADGVPIFIQTMGPAALSVNDVQLNKYGKEYFPSGFSSPVGKLTTSPMPLEDMIGEVLRRNGIEINKQALLNFEHDIVVEGIVRQILRSRAGKIILIEFEHATIQHRGNVILVAPSYIMAVGQHIVSAFAGPADVEAFQPTAFVPHEKMHKIHYDEKVLKLHDLYRIVRKTRQDTHLIPRLPSLWKIVVHDFPDDWLLSLEILEILERSGDYQRSAHEIREYLETKRAKKPHLHNLITNGLTLLHVEKEQPAVNE
ncbi:aromatic amino acid hydroxylase [Chryseolinea sp. H1M3-3]|uniref:aromatic amino acid hydroxylase n=1 Tax=Chryseolinea sp. H1M3-3 TaxID=3034144 RepID=UPI0023EB85B9|nr:aromatic amino acid hydroxylase [Chryseolinea sp. H1M3-3]